MPAFFLLICKKAAPGHGRVVGCGLRMFLAMEKIVYS